MSFLAPLFFAGLAALAIPVLVHLIQRERKNVVAFPSLMFLRRVPYESVRRRRIHNRALLIMRLAALALIIAAFARPFVRGSGVSASTDGAREVVILLDRSYSMGFADHWTRAQRAASEVANSLKSGDRVWLVLFGTDAQVAVRGSDDPARVISEIKASAPSSGATRYGPALKLAGSLLAESGLPRREVVLVSDFQRGGWSPGDGMRLPAGTVLTTVPIQGADAVNVSVTPVTLQRENFSGQERVVVSAGVINRSAHAVDNVDIALEVDGRMMQTTRVSLAAHAAGSTTFQPVTLTGDNVRARVRVAEDALAADNAFHLVLSPPRPVRVVLVNPPRASRESALYLTRALAIGEAPRFEITTRQVEELTDEVLNGARVLVLNDVGLSESAASRVKKFVENGGGLFAIYGPQASWSGTAADLLPASANAVVERTRGTAGSLGGLAYGHAVFEPFRAARSGDFSTARFYSYRNVTAAKDAQVLARFDDGSPALVARPHGRGRVLVWTSTLDLGWSDLPLKPVFLPFVHQISRHLAAHRERAAWSTVGQVLDLSEATVAETAQDAARTSDRELMALTPSGQRAAMQGDQANVLELAEHGFYEIRRQARDSQPLIVAAANVELSEGDPTPMDPQEIVAAVTGGTNGAGQIGGVTDLPDEAQERSQRLWWYLLFTGILLLIAESVLAHRISTVT